VMQLPYKSEELPEFWCEVTFDDIAKWGSGGTPKSGVKEYYNGDIPWLIIGDLNDGYVSNSEKKITQLGLSSSSAHIVEPNSVLVAMYGSIGKLGINKIPVATNQAIAFTAFLPSGLLNTYLFYYLLCMRPSLHSVGKGGTQKNISQTVLKVVPFPLSPLNEQRRIVAKIEELFSEVDAGVASLKTARAQLGVYRQSLLKQAFEGKLTEQWRAQNPDQLEPAEQLLARIRRERETCYQQLLFDWNAIVHEWEAGGKEGKKPTKPRKFGPPLVIADDELIKLPEIPENWNWMMLESISASLPRSIQSGPFGSSLKHSEFTENGILVIGIDNVQKGYFSRGSQNRISKGKYAELSKYTARPKDLLITIMATIGRCCRVPDLIEPAIITKHVYRISPNLALVDPDYLVRVICGCPTILKLFQSEQQGQTRPGLNGTIIKEFPVPLPKLPEQQEIVRILEAQFTAIEQNEAEIDAALQRGEALRQSILKKAFAGKLVPQDPHDEPASVLLERIRAEREAAEAELKAKKKASKKAVKTRATKKSIP
jgi:type I restriction enzyme S subunit